MSFLQINTARLLHHLEYDVRKHARGVMNWWLEPSDSGIMLFITLNIQSVDYLYKWEFSDFSSIPIQIKSMLTSNRYVLGYLSGEIKPKQDPPPEPQIPKLGLRLQADFLEQGAEAKW